MAGEFQNQTNMGVNLNLPVFFPVGGFNGTGTRRREVNISSSTSNRDPNSLGDEIILSPNKNLSDFILRNSIDPLRPTILAALQFQSIPIPPGRFKSQLGKIISTPPKSFDSPIRKLYDIRKLSRGLSLENVSTFFLNLEEENPDIIPQLMELFNKNESFLSSFFVSLNEVDDIMNQAKNALNAKISHHQESGLPEYSLYVTDGLPGEFYDSVLGLSDLQSGGELLNGLTPSTTWLQMCHDLNMFCEFGHTHMFSKPTDGGGHPRKLSQFLQTVLYGGTTESDKNNLNTGVLDLPGTYGTMVAPPPAENYPSIRQLEANKMLPNGTSRRINIKNAYNLALDGTAPWTRQIVGWLKEMGYAYGVPGQPSTIAAYVATCISKEINISARIGYAKITDDATDLDTNVFSKHKRGGILSQTFFGKFIDRLDSNGHEEALKIISTIGGDPLFQGMTLAAPEGLNNASRMYGPEGSLAALTHISIDESDNMQVMPFENEATIQNINTLGKDLFSGEKYFVDSILGTSDFDTSPINSLAKEIEKSIDNAKEYMKVSVGEEDGSDAGSILSPEGIWKIVREKFAQRVLEPMTLFSAETHVDIKEDPSNYSAAGVFSFLAAMGKNEQVYQIITALINRMESVSATSNIISSDVAEGSITESATGTSSIGDLQSAISLAASDGQITSQNFATQAADFFFQPANNPNANYSEMPYLKFLMWMGMSATVGNADVFHAFANDPTAVYYGLQFHNDPFKVIEGDLKTLVDIIEQEIMFEVGKKYSHLNGDISGELIEEEDSTRESYYIEDEETGTKTPNQLYLDQYFSYEEPDPEVKLGHILVYGKYSYGSSKHSNYNNIDQVTIRSLILNLLVTCARNPGITPSVEDLVTQSYDVLYGLYFIEQDQQLRAALQPSFADIGINIPVSQTETAFQQAQLNSPHEHGTVPGMNTVARLFIRMALELEPVPSQGSTGFMSTETMSGNPNLPYEDFIPSVQDSVTAIEELDAGLIPGSTDQADLPSVENAQDWYEVQQKLQFLHRDAYTAFTRLVNVSTSISNAAKSLKDLFDFDGAMDSTKNILRQVITSGVGGGIDIYSNLSHVQIGLKQAAAISNAGDPNNFYIPREEILYESDYSALEVLMKYYGASPYTTGINPDQVNDATVLTFGVPIGMVDSIMRDSTHPMGGFNGGGGPNQSPSGNLQVTVEKKDLELDELTFDPLTFQYDPHIYLLPGCFEETGDKNAPDTMMHLIHNAIYHVQDVNDKFKFERKTFKEIFNLPKYSNLDRHNPAEADKVIDILRNHIESYLLKRYYKLMLGLDLGESCFLSLEDLIKLKVDEEATSFASSAIDIYSRLSGHVVSSSSVVGRSESPARVFNAEDIQDLAADAGISSVDLSQIRNFLSSRLFSGNVFLNSAMAARAFDRVFLKLVDPDDYTIKIDREVVKRFTNAIIEAPLTPSPYAYYDSLVDKGILTKESVVIETAGEFTQSSQEEQYRVLSKKKNEASQSLSQYFIHIKTTSNLNTTKADALLADNHDENFALLGNIL